MKFLLIAPKNRTVYNFRGDLISQLQKIGYTVIVTSPDTHDNEQILKMGVRLIRIPINKNGTNVLDDLRYCFNLYKLIYRENPDVILSYTIKPIVYGSIAAWIAGIKNINSLITGAGYTFTSKSTKAKLLNLITKALYKVSLRLNTHVIFQNSDDRIEFIKNKLVKEMKTAIVNGSGVNVNRFYKQELPDRICFFTQTSQLSY